MTSLSMTSRVLIGLLSTFLSLPALAEAEELELDPAHMERLGKLSGEVVLPASVLKRMDARCAGGRPMPDYTAELDRDVAALPENFQAAYSMQQGAALKVGDYIARDLLSKTKGCASAEFRAAYARTEGEYRQALQRWRQRGP